MKYDFNPPSNPQANVSSLEEYTKMYNEADKSPNEFWGKRANELVSWDKPWDTVLSGSFNDIENLTWFDGAKLNACYNCVDRHVENGKKDKPAIIWQGEPEEDVRIITFGELQKEVSRFAQVLKKNGVRKGDRVALYMPMIPELSIAMLACARIGAIHAAIFAGFSAASLHTRLHDTAAEVLITADTVIRSGKNIPLKASADQAVPNTHVETMIVVNRGNQPVTMEEGRDLWWHEEMEKTEDTILEPLSMNTEDILFILYTSGSTGTAKGIAHATGGYLTYAAHTMQLVFDANDKDIHWCTADHGWITGHTYGLYAPLTLGVTTLMFEGVPSYPNAERFWHIIDKFNASIFYTAPTAIRSLMKDGEELPAKYKLDSLRVLGSVGEPINPEAWQWYHKNIGHGKIPLVDTWWQTETGGIIIAAIPFAIPLKAGSATLPLPGISISLLDADKKSVGTDNSGHLLISKPWPGMAKTIYKAASRFEAGYFKNFPGHYESGDGAHQDTDGYFWIEGRLDDVINVSGHRMGSAEIESAFAAHRSVVEAAAVAIPHAIKGESIYAYVTLQQDIEPSDELKKELVLRVRKEIGPIATPEVIQFTNSLPKTRSGKIMRRILRKIATGEEKEFGDISTLADPSVIEILVAEKKALCTK